MYSSKKEVNPYGMLMPGRTYSSTAYRYGFNGKENIDEINGEGNELDFGARIYDCRIGKLLSLDPKSREFPWMSPFVFAANNPIRFIEINGEGPGDVIEKINAFANEASNYAWAKSNNGGEKVTEYAFQVVAKTQQLIINKDKVEQTTYSVVDFHGDWDGSGGFNVIYPNVVAQFHTHPYSKSEGNRVGAAFSAADIFDMIGNKKDFVSFVEAGTQRFALIVTDETKMNEFFKTHSKAALQQAWNEAFTKADGTFQEKAKAATAAVVGTNSGIGFYESDSKKEKFKEVKPPIKRQVNPGGNKQTKPSTKTETKTAPKKN